MLETTQDTSVKVAVRIRPLNEIELLQDLSLCLDVVKGRPQIRAGENNLYTFDNVFSSDTCQDALFQDCVADLLNAAFEGFNATILAYGQTGSGKTYTMGSSADMQIAEETQGIIPRVIRNLFDMIAEREAADPRSTYRVHVQFLEIYGEDIKDLLDQTRTSKVTIREMRSGEVFVTGAREEFVASYEQMMKSLEDGTHNRTTAATKMNQTSSRSHAIFTVVLEHTILTEPDPAVGGDGEVDAAITQEVRKSKFHFVDLAGSERAKRTGAQGQQLREGIDINKGLLALGNVISALGDETKRGKVFVPYRDSKLTRMLQDSLGGNSKTLMICCVSPAASNFNESLNALRYANRARNIKNKPVVNRDPTLIIIDELRGTLKAVATELLEIRTRKQLVEGDSRITVDLLRDLVAGGHGGGKLFRTDSTVAEALQQAQAQGQNQGSQAPSSSAPSSSSGARPPKPPASVSAESKKLSVSLAQAKQDIADLQVRLAESDFELKRQIDQVKLHKQRTSELADQLYLVTSERAFFRMKWAEACPEEARALDASQAGQADRPENEVAGSEATNGSVDPIENEQGQFTRAVAGYLREIAELKQQLAVERSLVTTKAVTDGPPELDHEFTANLSSVLAQARTQLEEECKKLKSIEEGDEDDDEERSVPTPGAEIEMEKAFAKRQKLLSGEVQELGQSILLKEQLMEQLLRSQQQYGVMKQYYEQRLSSLGEAVRSKQEERDRLAQELSEVAAHRTEAMRAREAKLIEDLKVKDDDLKAMKRKEDELRHLSQAQSKYTQQMAKLQADIVDMKRQRVDLSKTLQNEKKHHLIALNEKAKEIDGLKRQLLKSASEVRRLGRDKEIAESRVKDALREKKRAVDAAKQVSSQSAAPVVAAFASLSGDPTVAAAKEALRAISKSSSRSKRVLSEQELRTKRWLDARVTEISAREAAAEALKRQYEQQLELLTRKETLERERVAALEKQLQDKELTGTEEEALLEMIEDRLSSINGQLHVRSQRISDISAQMDQPVAGDASSTADSLKKMAAGHDVIRLLMEMLVHANKTVKLKAAQLAEQADLVKALQQRADDSAEKLSALQHGHDKEMTRLNQEYEAKLQDVYAHVSTLHADLPSSISRGSGGDVDSDGPGGCARKKSIDPLELQLSIALSEHAATKAQLQREALKYAQLLGRFDEVEAIKQRLIWELEERNRQVKFLEEDRGLFKDMAEDLKAGLQGLGRDGRMVVETVKDRARQTRTQQGAPPAGNLFMHMDLSDDEDDTKSVLGAFDMLGEEIFRTGDVQPRLDGGREKERDGKDVKDPVPGGSSIYDRLSNPSSYTGSMKTVFNKDIETLRQRTARIRNQEKRGTPAAAPKRVFFPDSGVGSGDDSGPAATGPGRTAGETPEEVLPELPSPAPARFGYPSRGTKSLPKRATSQRARDDPTPPPPPPSQQQQQQQPTPPGGASSSSPLRGMSPDAQGQAQMQGSVEPHIWSLHPMPTREMSKSKSSRHSLGKAALATGPICYSPPTPSPSSPVAAGGSRGSPAPPLCTSSASLDDVPSLELARPDSGRL